MFRYFPTRCASSSWLRPTVPTTTGFWLLSSSLRSGGAQHLHLPQCQSTPSTSDRSWYTSSLALKSEQGGSNAVVKDQILVNERLIRELMRRTGAMSTSSVQVRVIAEQGRGNKPLVEIKSLEEAMKIALSMELDLIGTNISQNPPIVSIKALSTVVFKQLKGTAKQLASSAAKPTKSFRFKTGIGETDLQRKIDEILGFLAEGHACIVQVTGSRRRSAFRVTTNREESVVLLIDKIIEMVGPSATSPDGTDVDEGFRSVSIRLEPTKLAKKAKRQEPK